MLIWLGAIDEATPRPRTRNAAFSGLRWPFSVGDALRVLGLMPYVRPQPFSSFDVEDRKGPSIE